MIRSLLPRVAGLALALCLSAPAAAQACENAQVRVENHSTALPDCRAYEQVSPTYKGAYSVVPQLISPTGSRMYAESFGTFAGSEANNIVGAAYQFNRTASGWAATAISPSSAILPHAIPTTGGSADESSAGATIWSTFEGQDNLFLRNPDASITTVGPMLPDATQLGLTTTEYVGASPGFSHVFFTLYRQQVSARTWPFDKTQISTTSLYEYAGTGNTEPTLVAVKGGLGDHTQIGTCGNGLGDATTFGSSEDTYNAISQSGETVFFTVNACGAEPAVNEVYARIDARKTIAISSPEHPLVQGNGAGPDECDAACESQPPAQGIFQGASQDGTKVFFLTSQPLLNGDEDTSLDLYMGELGGVLRLTQVSRDPDPGQPAEVQGVTRVSEDGSRVYFVALGALAGENAEHKSPTLGQDNLYAYDTVTHHTTFVVTVSPSDHISGARDDSFARRAQATPDGGFLLFASTGDLTGEGTGTTEQLYRYDASSGELARVSIGQCPAPGAPCSSAERFNEDGRTSFVNTKWPEYHETDGISNRGTSMSSDGSDVFFTSRRGLTPNALNHVFIDEPEPEEEEFANNVYEWHDGEVFLISDGNDRTFDFNGESNVTFIGADPSGANVFFTTGDPLSPTDSGELQDVYDARIGGGFPAPAAAGPCSSGEACQGPAGTQPSVLAPGSLSVTGAGNLSPPPPPPPPAAAGKTLTRAQRLAKARKACHAKPRRRRHSCEAQARRRYGPKPKARKGGR